jgi:hypothetical protein
VESNSISPHKKITYRDIANLDISASSDPVKDVDGTVEEDLLLPVAAAVTSPKQVETLLEAIVENKQQGLDHNVFRNFAALQGELTSFLTPRKSVSFLPELESSRVVFDTSLSSSSIMSPVVSLQSTSQEDALQVDQNVYEIDPEYQPVIDPESGCEYYWNPTTNDVTPIGVDPPMRLKVRDNVSK